MIQQALVTGANGFIGAALTRRLLRDGVPVRAMCRDPRKGETLAQAGAEVVGGDVQLPDTLAHASAGCDVIFHVAAVSAGAVASFNVNVLGTQNVLDAARNAGVSRFVHVGTVAVYGYDIDGQIDESRPHRPSRHDYYMQSKSTGEKLVWATARKTGLPCVCVRPAFVYGPGSGFWSRQLYNLCRQRQAPLIAKGTGSAHPVYVEDVVDLLVTAATHPNAPGVAFHAAPDPAPTWGEFLGHYARMAGTGARAFIEIPAAAASLANLIRLATRLRGTPLDLPGMLAYLAQKATYSMKRAETFLGWRPRFSLEAGMAETEKWLNSRSPAAES